jgi:hypothetical protein
MRKHYENPKFEEGVKGLCGTINKIQKEMPTDKNGQVEAIWEAIVARVQMDRKQFPDSFPGQCQNLINKAEGLAEPIFGPCKRPAADGDPNQLCSECRSHATEEKERLAKEWHLIDLEFDDGPDPGNWFQDMLDSGEAVILPNDGSK